METSYKFVLKLSQITQFYYNFGVKINSNIKLLKLKILNSDYYEEIIFIRFICNWFY